MASFTSVGDSVQLNLTDRSEEVTVSLSGTYNMTIVLEKEQGSPGSGSWELLKTYSEANATVSETFTVDEFRTAYRLRVTVDTSGTCTATLTDGDKVVKLYTDDLDNVHITAKQSGVEFPGNVTIEGDTAVTGTSTFTGNATFDGDVTVDGTFSATLSFTGLVEQVTGHIEEVADKAYFLDQSAAYAYTINTLIIDAASGTCDAAIEIEGTPVTGISAVSVSSTEATGTATAANSVAVGDTVELVLSNNSAALDVRFTLKLTRV